MSQGTAIEWTEATWNPVTGCDWVSLGCDHCYARTLAERLKGMGNARYQNDGFDKALDRVTPGFKLTLHPDKLEEPLRWKKPRVVFVNSMSDLFHPDVPDEFIRQTFAVMGKASQHQFQVLTKRTRRMLQLLRDGIVGEYLGTPLPNVWLGTSVENQEWADKRIPLLLETPAAVRFLSCEPLLGPVTLLGEDHRGHERDWDGWGYVCLDCGTEDTTVEWFQREAPEIDWVIVGGESGPNYRPFNPDWARLLRDECLKSDIPFFFKQYGGRTPKAGGRELDGRTWDQMPVLKDEREVLFP